MRTATAAVLAAILAATAWAADPPRIAGDLHAPANGLVRLEAVNLPAKTGLLWRVSPPLASVATTDKRRFEFAAPPGTYDVELTLFSILPDGTPDLSALAVRVTVGGVPPVPPVPPGPDPVPPVPPVPPVDPLTRALQAAYDRDPPDCAGVPKAGCKDRLLRVYRAAANTDLDAYKTAGELHTALRQMAKTAALPDDALPFTRTAISIELKQVLPVSPTAQLTQDSRANAKSLFGRLATSLEAIR